jgi:hypothetical protein
VRVLAAAVLLAGINLAALYLYLRRAAREHQARWDAVLANADACPDFIEAPEWVIDGPDLRGLPTLDACELAALVFPAQIERGAL